MGKHDTDMHGILGSLLLLHNVLAFERLMTTRLPLNGIDDAMH
jgi:hypothetical protein